MPPATSHRNYYYVPYIQGFQPIDKLSRQDYIRVPRYELTLKTMSSNGCVNCKTDGGSDMTEADRYSVKIKVISQKGTCNRGHKLGDEWVI